MQISDNLMSRTRENGTENAMSDQHHEHIPFWQYGSRTLTSGIRIIFENQPK